MRFSPLAFTCLCYEWDLSLSINKQSQVCFPFLNMHVCADFMDTSASIETFKLKMLKYKCYLPC